MPAMQKSLDEYFGLTDHATTASREALAGVTTFLAMAYITVVNPLILSDAGMDFGAVFVATCIAAAVGSLVMGLLANYPIGLAPGMGQNAFFTYAVVVGSGHTWQAALGAVFLSFYSSSLARCLSELGLSIRSLAILSLAWRRVSDFFLPSSH